MSVTDEYLRSSAVYAERRSGPLRLPPAMRAASLNSALSHHFSPARRARV
jgi:hypothetical protein